MNFNDRQEVNRLAFASGGQGGDSSRKRLRDEDGHPSGSSRRNRHSLTSGPYSKINRNDLREDRRRASNGKNILTKSNLKVASVGASSSTSMAHSVFSRTTETSRTGTLPDLEGNGTAFAGAQTSSFCQSSAQQPQPEGLTKETDHLMSGLVPFSDIFENSEMPNSPERKERDPGVMGSRSRSSSDPINMIQPSNNATNPITVEDDEIVEEQPPPRSRPRASTPKGKTPLREGRVREQIEMIESKTQTKSTLDGYLGPKSPSQSGRSSRTAPGRSSSSKGLPIPPGITRRPPQAPQQLVFEDMTPRPPQGKISERMGPKNSTKITQPTQPSKGLKVQSKGVQERANQRPSHQKEQHDQISLKIQEWYCGSKRYESNDDEQDLYSFNFDGRTASLVYQKAGKRVSSPCLLKGDIDAFEVADKVESIDNLEFLPYLVFLVQDKTFSKSDWGVCWSGDDHRIVVHFDAQPEDFSDSWRELVSRLSTWVPKRDVRIDDMKRIIKHLASSGSTVDKTRPQIGPRLNVPRFQDNNDGSHGRPTPSEARSRSSSPPVKARTRSALSKFKNEDGEDKDGVKPIVLQDLDEVMLVYPPGGPGAVTINRGELARLEPGEFLNDTLIELGLKLWLNGLRAEDPRLGEQVHVFSSFFFKKLDGGRGKSCDYNSVKKWTSKFDLFSKKFVVVPINEHLHWYLAIIYFPENVLKAPPPQALVRPIRVTRSNDATAAKSEERRMSSESDMPNADQNSTIDVEAGSPTEPGRMEIDNELADQSQKMAIDSATPPEVLSDTDVKASELGSEPPILDMTNDDNEDTNTSQPLEDKSQKAWILILDSLGGKHPRTVRILRQYLQLEAQERHQAIVELKDAKSSGGFVEDKHLSVPVQPNWCDCGIYLLHFVEVFYSNPLKILALPPNAKRKGHPDAKKYQQLWRTDEITGKRDHFRDVIHALSSDWIKDHKPSISKNSPSSTEKPEPDETQGLPLLPSLEADASVQLIEAPNLTESSDSTTNTFPSLNPQHQDSSPRTGTLASGPIDVSEEEVEIIVAEPVPDRPPSSKSTRRASSASL